MESCAHAAANKQSSQSTESDRDSVRDGLEEGEDGEATVERRFRPQWVLDLGLQL